MNVDIPLPRRFAPLLLALLSLLCVGATAESPQFSVRIDPPAGEVGLVMTLSVAVAGALGADCALVETPVADGCRVALAAGPVQQQSSVYVNGQLTRSMRTEWRFQLVPQRTGTLQIPGVRFNCRGEEVSTSPMSVSVSASTLEPDVVGLELRPSADQLWAGQTVTLEISASILEERVQQHVKNWLELDLPWYDGVPGLMRLETPPPAGESTAVRLVDRRDALEMRVSRDAATGRIVLTRAVQLLATAPGTIELPESRFSAMFALATERDRNDPFAGMFGGGLSVTRAAIMDASAKGVVFEVRAPPEQGRPASFTNAVGRFKFSATATPSTLRVGDTCTLTLTLVGDGNLDFVEWPAFDELSRDFRVFGKNERKLPRTRVLEIQVSPKTARVTEVPALEFSAFDPAQGSYDRLTVGPYPLSVSPGGEDGLATLESPTDTLSSLETIRESLPPAEGGGLPAWTWWCVGLLALVAAEVRVRRAAWHSANPRLLARRGARTRLAAALDEARDAHAVCTAFAHFLADRLDGPPAGLSADEAAPRLSDAALVRDLRGAWARWEASAVGGASIDLAAARAEAAQLADRVEAGT